MVFVSPLRLWYVFALLPQKQSSVSSANQVDKNNAKYIISNVRCIVTNISY